MTAKKFNLKDFLINNGIIVVLVLLAIYTGDMSVTHYDDTVGHTDQLRHFRRELCPLRHSLIFRENQPQSPNRRIKP